MYFVRMMIVQAKQFTWDYLYFITWFLTCCCSLWLVREQKYLQFYNMFDLKILPIAVLIKYFVL